MNDQDFITLLACILLSGDSLCDSDIERAIGNAMRIRKMVMDQALR